MSISDELAKARNAAGLTQAEAARAAGVSRATVNNAENGRYLIPSWRTLQSLARVYEVDVRKLISPHGGDGSDSAEATPERDQAEAPTAA